MRTTTLLTSILLSVLICSTAAASAEPDFFPAPAVDRQVLVRGTSAGTRTGVTVAPGDQMRFSATGLVNTLPPFTDSEGGPNGNGNPCTLDCLVPDADFGALIGKIGDGGPGFVIGQQSNRTADRSGEVILAVNDSIFFDNEGQYQVSIHVETPAGCTADATTLCLRGRFRVQVFWRTQGQSGSGKIVTSAADSGLFWFFDSANWEMLVKVLDGCALNSRFWVFAAATTDVEYTLRITDTLRGTTKEYTHAQGKPAISVMDTSALATCP